MEWIKWNSTCSRDSWEKRISHEYLKKIEFFHKLLWYRIFCASNYTSLIIILLILVGFWEIIPRVVTVFPVLQWLTEDAIQHHLLMIVEKVSVWRQICVIQNIENYGEFTLIFIMLYKNPYHFSLDILNSLIRNWLLRYTLHQREPLIILSHCLFHSELEFVFWYSQGFGMCFEMVTRPEGLTHLSILKNDE